MNKDSFINNLKECNYYLTKYKKENIFEYNNQNYRHEYSKQDKRNTRKFGIYCESFMDKYFIGNVKPGKKVKNKPDKGEYIEYLFNESNFLEYILYHNVASLEIWKFIQVNEKTKIGICNDGNRLVLIKYLSSTSYEYHSLYFDSELVFTFQFETEINQFIDNKIICTLSQYRNNGCNVEQFVSENGKYLGSSRISHFTYSEDIIKEMIHTLALDELRTKKYLEWLADTRAIEDRICSLNKKGFEEGYLVMPGKETNDSVF